MGRDVTSAPLTRTERASGASRVYAGGELLTLTLRAVYGDSLVQLRAASFRFCADGTIRANGNSLAATRVDDCWRLGQRLFRDFECVGPVYLRARRTAAVASQAFGPFALVRTAGALVYGDEACLDVKLPNPHHERAETWHEVSLLLKMDA